MGFFDIGYSGEPVGKLFGFTHWCWLIGIAAAGVVLCVIHRRLSDRGRTVFRRSVALSMFGLYLLRQLIIAIQGEYGPWCLPLHLCGMSLYIETLDSLIQKKFTRELCYAVCMPGALMGMLFADWIDTPVLNFLHISCSVFHGLMIIYPLLSLTSGDFRPNARRLPLCFGFLAAVSVPVYFFNRSFGTNFMFLSEPSPGSPLVWFEQWLGNPGYLLGFVIMIAIVWAVMYIPFIWIKTPEPRVERETEE